MVRLHFDPRSEPGGWRPARWVVPLFALAGIVLVPWILFVIRSLPSTHAAAHWDIAWAGFDFALALLLLGVAIAAWRRSPWLEGAASAAAALLFVDAWFDILTSTTNGDRLVAIGEATLVELPLAVLLLLIARDAERILAGVSGSVQRVTGSRVEEQHPLGGDLQAHPLVGHNGRRRAEARDEQFAQ
jgi:hypothetical protein